MHSEKPKPKTVIYSPLKNFTDERLSLDFLSEFEKYLDCLFNGFYFALTSVLQKYAALK